MHARPFREDHYTYVKNVLNEELKAGQAIESTRKAAIIARLREEQEKLAAIEASGELELAKANIEKMRRILEILEDEKKRNDYDAALLGTKAKDKIQLTSDEEVEDSVLLPLAPIEDICAEFETMKAQLLADNPAYKEGDFSYESIPQPDGSTLYKFSFPDEESRNKFMQQLCDKNMVMLPGGSQDLQDMQRPKPPVASESSGERPSTTAADVERQRAMREQIHTQRPGSAVPTTLSELPDEDVQLPSSRTSGPSSTAS